MLPAVRKYSSTESDTHTPAHKCVAKLSPCHHVWERSGSFCVACVLQRLLLSFLHFPSALRVQGDTHNVQKHIPHSDSSVCIPYVLSRLYSAWPPSTRSMWQEEEWDGFGRRPGAARGGRLLAEELLRRLWSRETLTSPSLKDRQPVSKVQCVIQWSVLVLGAYLQCIISGCFK